MVASLSKIQKYLSKFLFEPQQKLEIVKLSWNCCFQNVNNEVSAEYTFSFFLLSFEEESGESIQKFCRLISKN